MAELIEVAKKKVAKVSVYSCGDCGHDFPHYGVPLYCPGCGEQLNKDED